MRITNYLGLHINWLLLFFFKVAYFSPQKDSLFKKFPKFYYSVYYKKRYVGICIYVLNAMMTSNLLYLLNPRRSSLLHECPQTHVYFL